MKILGVNAKSILDSRKEKTIEVSIETDAGKFSASSPSGKSTGKYEVPCYKKSLQEDIDTIKKFSEYFSDENIESFDDLRRVEDILQGHVGANTFIALEYAALKALAKEKKKQIWQLINPKAKNFPRFVGNCVGGGAHTKNEKKPDFQEFLLIPNKRTTKENAETNKKIQGEMEFKLIDKDSKFKKNRNDENAWVTSLNEKEVLESLYSFNVPLGLDIASSNFYKRKKYYYENPRLVRTADEQLEYLSNLIKNYRIFYIEDPFDENDFDSFAKLLKKYPNSLIVGDDLTVTNSKRLQKAIEKKSINAIIVKPNQCGSLIEVKKVCEIAKKHNIKIVFSHRSGETEEDFLADLAFGFQADFFKCGISGKGREPKIKRLIEIEKKFR